MVTTKKSYSSVITAPLTINISENNLESIVILPFYFILAYCSRYAGKLAIFFSIIFWRWISDSDTGQFSSKAIKLAIYGKNIHNHKPHHWGCAQIGIESNYRQFKGYPILREMWGVVCSWTVVYLQYYKMFDPFSGRNFLVLPSIRSCGMMSHWVATKSASKLIKLDLPSTLYWLSWDRFS